MENTRRGEERKSQPHNNRHQKKEQVPMGFEGMNYEQKRKPYGENSSLADQNGYPVNNTNTRNTG